MRKLNSARIALTAMIGLTAVAGCAPERSANVVAAGDPTHGAALIRSYGCGTCHTVPGVTGARGMVGPPLGGWARRTFIAGALPNQPDNLIRWIMDPQGIEPGTAMPGLGVTEPEARDIAAYLFTLEEPPEGG